MGTISKDEFFKQDMYLVRVTGWSPEHLTPEQPVESSGEQRLTICLTAPSDTRHLPLPGADDVLHSSAVFSLMNSGNRTLRAPKRSWKIGFESGDQKDRLLGMSCLNLKAMFNDPSQMREALAWRLLAAAGVPSSRHSYAKFGINDAYRGLFSVIEQVDKGFLKDHFGKNDRGNLYKVYCGDLGCGTLAHRVGRDGDDSGRQYFTPGSSDLTYRLKTNEDDPAANSYDDLATLIRVIDGVGLPGGDDRFATDAFRESVENVMNARAFLRWAGVNVLIGSWDNYFATPANYYLYNSGRRGGEDDFVTSPYFTFIPWDYDNSFGIDFFDTQWQYTSLVDWPANTRNYYKTIGSRHQRSHLPLLTNLLRNHDFCQYYLDHLEHLLDTSINADWISRQIAVDGAGGGLWERISPAAYLESDTPYGQPFTGRQFTNDLVHSCGYKQYELQSWGNKVEGIVHYVRMRHDSARAQLTELRKSYPAGAGAKDFPGSMEPLPMRPAAMASAATQGG